MTEHDHDDDDPGAWTTAGRHSAPAATHPCPCRSEHAPAPVWTHRHHLWPLYDGGPDTDANVAYVCPATHDWAHVIWRAFERAGEPTPRERGWPHHAYELAVRGWQLRTAAG